MRVISQSGRHSVEFEDVSISYFESVMKSNDTKYIFYAETNDGHRQELGKYSSQEKAEQVFSDMHVRYADVKRNELVLSAESDLMIKYCEEGVLDQYLEKTKWSYLFQLPKDEDVVVEEDC